MLEDKLETLANQIGQFGLAAALITFGAMAGQYTWHTLVQEGRPWDWAMLSTYLKYAITAITILVSSLPPPLSLAIVLALGRFLCLARSGPCSAPASNTPSPSW